MPPLMQQARLVHGEASAPAGRRAHRNGRPQGAHLRLVVEVLFNASERGTVIGFGPDRADIRYRPRFASQVTGIDFVVVN